MAIKIDYGSYQGQEKPGVMRSPEMYAPPAEVNMWESGAAGLAAANKELKNIAVLIKQKEEDDDKMAAFNALNEYNMRSYALLYNKENGLMHNEGETAKGISQGYLEEEKNIRNDVLKTAKFHNNASRLALIQSMDKSAISNFQAVDQHEWRQDEAARINTVNNCVEISSAGAIDRYWDIENVQALSDNVEMFSEGVYSRYGEAKSKEMQQKNAAAVWASAISAAIANDDTDTADRLIERAEGYLSKEQRLRLMEQQHSRVEDKMIRSAAKDIWERSGGDYTKALSMLKETPLAGVVPDGEGTTWVKNSGAVETDGLTAKAKNGLNTMAQIYSGLTGGGQLIVTSGTDSAELHMDGLGSHAAGWKVDVDTEWLRDADNRARFKAECEAQGIHILDEYESPSINSTGGHLDVNFSHFKGAPLAMDDKTQEKVDRRLRMYASQQEAAARYEAEKDFAAIKKSVYDFLSKGTPYEEAYNWAVKQGGDDLDKAKKYASIVNDWYGIYGNSFKGHSSGQGGSFFSDSAMYEVLTSGSLTSQADVLAWCRERGFNGKDAEKALTHFRNYIERKGVYDLDIDKYLKIYTAGIKDERLRQALIDGGRQYICDQAALLEAEKGRAVTKAEILPLLKKAVDKETAMQSLAGILKADKLGNGYVNVVRRNGTSGWITEEDYEDELKVFDDPLNKGGFLWFGE